MILLYFSGVELLKPRLPLFEVESLVFNLPHEIAALALREDLPLQLVLKGRKVFESFGVLGAVAWRAKRVAKEWVIMMLKTVKKLAAAMERGEASLKDASPRHP